MANRMTHCRSRRWQNLSVGVFLLLMSPPSFGQSDRMAAFPRLESAASQEASQPGSRVEAHPLVLPIRFQPSNEAVSRPTAGRLAKNRPDLERRVLKPSIKGDAQGTVRTASFDSPLQMPLRPSRDRSARRRGLGGSVVTVVGALSVVLGLFLSLVWVSRRVHRNSSLLPQAVIHPLGRFPLSPRQQAHVVRFGSKILVLAVSASGTTKLAELDDPEEVDQLTSLCLSGQVSPSQLRYEMDRVVRDRERSPIRRTMEGEQPS